MEIYDASVASFSAGKDSACMVLRLIQEGHPLTHIVFYDTGMEFDCVKRNVERMRVLAESKGIVFTVLKPERDWLWDMLIKPVLARDGSTKYGSDWCGGVCRWRTRDKVSSIERYLKTLGNCRQYIGYAADEIHRAVKAEGKEYPLIEWGMTEADCLKYCYEAGWNWIEDGVELYSILDRVSCWCCKNKNLKELRAYYHDLPRYWAYLKGLQSRIDRPFRGNETIFDLEERFRKEDERGAF